MIVNRLLPVSDVPTRNLSARDHSSGEDGQAMNFATTHLHTGAPVILQVDKSALRSL